MRKVVIIGGVAGGMSAAARLRRRDEHAEIVVVEQGEYVSYANCGLPYYLGGEIKDRQSLLVQTPEAFRLRFRVDVRTSQRAILINRKQKAVSIHDLKKDQTYEESYDELILSPGALPIRPPLPGIDLPGIFAVRTVPDTDAIQAYIEAARAKSAVIVGAGYIGLEMAENLRQRGIAVHIVEMSAHVMPLLDSEMAAAVEQELALHQVNFSLSSKVVAFAQVGEKLQTTLENGEKLVSELVILALGVRPASELAVSADLALGGHGGIRVNEFLQTNDPHIYAIGDAIEVPFLPTRESLPIALAGPANKQGRLAADNIVDGNVHPYQGVVGTSILKVFDLNVALTGLSSEQLDRAGTAHLSVIVHPGHHAGYYPGAKPLDLKLTFSPADGKILGGQVVGYEGVDKRIDVLSIALMEGWTVDRLTEFEQAYAPPFSSAKDPINMLGFAAQNILRGEVKTVGWQEFLATAAGAQLLDVRTPEEIEVHPYPRAIHIPVDELRDRLDELDPAKPVLTFCRVGQRGYLAARILTQNGFVDVKNLSGGLLTLELAQQKKSAATNFDERYETGMQPTPEAEAGQVITQVVDACGLQCPGPIMQLKKGLDSMEANGILEIQATDSGFYNDVQSWVKATGNELVSLTQAAGVITAQIKKRHQRPVASRVAVHENGKTIIVFDNDLDRLIASFIIANGALSMGREVTMFFTFWGLSALRKDHPSNLPKKNLVEKMFGFMLPKGSRELHLSKMDFGGLGAQMIRRIMQSKNIDSLESMIRHAMDQGVRIVACQMSMEMMGIKAEELIDGIEYAGVADYLEHAEHADTNLFI